ncbi:MAG: hypothetical protein M1820_009777 [Bogoriella megaspora]|nr:MAG: hypothetical protein M1820_009777 [Bogoriella megaspora]
MDFLKSAVVSAIQKTSAFPFIIGDRVDVEQSLWTLNNGTKRDDGTKCSIFTFDINANRNRLMLAKNTVRKLRTIRHPGVVKTDTHIYIVTERLTPLGWHTRRKSLAEETMKWGLYNVAKTLKFINEEGTSVHGAVKTSSVFTSDSGEWKLGGFDILSSMKDDEAIIYAHGSLVPDSARYAPPEVAKSGWEAVKRSPVYTVDSYNFGVLMFEVFNGGFSGGDQIGQTKNIPPSMHQSYKRLLNPNPKARLSVGNFLEQGRRHGGFFQTPLIHLTEGIESLGLKDEMEREEFLSQLDGVQDDFPEEFFKSKVLPELLKSVEFGGGGPKVFQVVMKISAKLSDEEFDAQVTPVVVRLFNSQDRAMRVCLLDNLPLIIDHLSQKLVSDKIFPQMVTGFTDAAPLVREQTVKAVLTVISKLSDRVINGELLRYLAKTANDEQPGIRTNTTICLGKIAKSLGTSTRAKVLVAAFARALRDPFVHARNAALLALAATSDCYSEDDCATKILPALCPSLLDKEKLVRDQANKTLDVYLQRVRKHATTLPDTLQPPSSSSGATAGSAPRMGTPQNDTSWAGWAISSFTNKLSSAKGEINSNTNGIANGAPRSNSVPPTVDRITPTASTTNTASSLRRQALISPTPSEPDSHMSNSASNIAEDFNDHWGDETTADANDDWGSPSISINDPFSPQPKVSPVAGSATFDDNGEPDFAGWLTAQAQAKQKTKNPLPKGLAKSTTATARPSVGVRSSTTPSVAAANGSKKPVVAAKPVKKTPEPPPPAQEDDEGWGDAWE